MAPDTLDSTAVVRPTHRVLGRLLGPVTATCVGVGAAIGSGIFATPGDAAKYLHSPWLLLMGWLVVGAVTLMQGLVTAELATRFPKAGGEYEFLKKAYGEFAGFFFGWSCTIFIIGGGAGTIAAALGEFAAELFGIQQAWAPGAFGCAAVLSVTLVNAAGLRTGAAAQNVLALVKVLALMALAVGALIVSGRLAPATSPATTQPAAPLSVDAFFLALLPIFWSYTGATDSAKLAEELRDVRRSMPRALCASALLLTAVYGAYNYALLCALPPEAMAGRRSVPAAIFGNVELVGIGVGKLILVLSILICLSSISSSILSNVRATFALARDGLAFRSLGRMSGGQAPVASLLLAAAIACGFVLYRSFEKMLRIYFMASTVLFGLAYLSLVVFRVRDRRAGRPFPETAYRAPVGTALAVLLVLLEAVIAWYIVRADLRSGTNDSVRTIALLVGMVLFYVIWKRVHSRRPRRRV